MLVCAMAAIGGLHKAGGARLRRRKRVRCIPSIRRLGRSDEGASAGLEMRHTRCMLLGMLVGVACHESHVSSSVGLRAICQALTPSLLIQLHENHQDQRHYLRHYAMLTPSSGVERPSPLSNNQNDTNVRLQDHDAASCSRAQERSLLVVHPGAWVIVDHPPFDLLGPLWKVT